MTTDSKVTAEHLRRLAYLYIRQSSLHQVMENTESAQRQYALRQRALALGWPEERIVVIEDTRELDLRIDDVQYLTVREDTSENARPITQRQLVANALRMRPDRILLGEVRGGEAFDMLMANNTGHEGTITTVHANSATDAITRLLQLCALADEAQNFNPS